MSIIVPTSFRQIAIERCRELRKRQTPAEALLWQQLRGRGCGNVKFRRQHPIFYEYETGVSFYVADFYSFEKRLIIELDGNVHEHRQEGDRIREDNLRRLGYKILRFRNAEVEKEIGEVMERITKEL